MGIFSITNGNTSELSVIAISPIIEDCVTIYEYIVTTNNGDLVDIELTGNHYDAKYFTSVSETSFSDNTSLTYNNYLKVRFLLLNSGQEGIFSNATLKVTNLTLSKYYETFVQRENDTANCYDGLEYVLKSGDTMSGSLDMGDNNITNINISRWENNSSNNIDAYMTNNTQFGLEPSGGGDILGYNFSTNKWNIQGNEIVTSSEITSFLPLAGGTMQGTINMDGENIENINRIYLDSGDWQISKNILSSGEMEFIYNGSISYELSKTGVPFENNHLVTKAYVDGLTGVTLDSVPTDTSTNAVESNGVYDSLVDINSFAALNSINGDKLQDSSIGPSKLTGGISGSLLQGNSVTSTQIAPNAIGQSELGENAVDFIHINDTNSPTSGDVLSYNGTGLEWITAPLYEEGTFTPALQAGATSPYTYGSQVGSYVRIGNSIIFTIYISGINNAGTGDLSITGLPYLASPASVFPVEISGSNVNFYSILGETSAATIIIKAQTANDGNNSSTYPNVTFTSGTIRVSGSYITSEIFP